MLSSIASFLPSALHVNSSQDLPRPNINPDDPNTEDEDDADGRSVPPQRDVDTEVLVKGKDKDGKTPSETFIFVRPPPSKSNHPLNLQVQLVPPSGKPPAGVVSSNADGTATTPTSANCNTSSSDGASLSRTSSNRSDVSLSTYSSSTTSFTSVASSSSSARRTIIPLYNLQAHNVLTNVIVDAGTDAKIARFQKRGIELIDLALLEPVEVWGEKDKEKDAKRESMRISVDEMGAMMTNVSTRGSLLSARSVGGFLQPGGGSRPVTPSAASSAASLHSHSQQQHTQSHPMSSTNAHGNSSIQAPQAHNVVARNSQFLNYPANAANKNDTSNAVNRSVLDSTAPTPMPLSPTPMPKRNIFNKLFNKRGSGTTTSSSGSSTTTSPTETPPSFSSFSLHPVPVTSKTIARDFGKRGGRETAPPLPPLQPPVSPTSPTSQQTTPTQPETPRQEEPLSPTPTVAPPKEKGHGKNLSLTSAIRTPILATLRNNKNRLSAVVHSASTGLGITTEEKDGASKRDSSPNPSVARSIHSRVSFVGTADTHSTGSSGGGSPGSVAQQQPPPMYPLVLTQSQTQEMTNLKQQQLQLRPPVLGIQPTFVSSASSSSNTAAAALSASVASPLVAALSPRAAENPEMVLQGQRALMYVWLVRRWLKRRPSVIANPFGETGFFGALAGGAAGGKGSSKQQLLEKQAHAGHAHAPMYGIHGARTSEASVGSTGGGVAGATGAPPPLAFGGVEVRFEWKRAKAKDAKGAKGLTAKKSRRGRTPSGRGPSFDGDGAESDGEVERASMRGRDERGDVKERLKSEEKRKHRMSTGSYASTTNASEEGHGGDASMGGRRLRREGTRGEAADDGGYESDPEDSETPWVCTLKIRRSAAVAGGGVHPTSLLSPIGSVFGGVGGPIPVEPQILRIKVGTLSPTPHHPKVVAMLKVPFPLPDVEVERMGVVRRKGFPVAGQTPQTKEDDAKEPYNGLMLTAEEIKDVVCSTGLWLVVREGFGGVGRVSRKGDGWRLRA